jgi:hypothetical protein
MKPTRRRYFWVVLLVLLAACRQQIVALPTETPIPTVVSPTPVPTSTFIPVTVTPSPMPTEPIIPIITPDPVQVEKWNEYEDALALAFFKSYYQPEEVVCEWVILGQTDREVYVWAHCASIYSAGPSQGSIPTVIRIGANGSVQNAEIPGSGTAYGPSIRRLFPPDLQEIIFDHSVLFSQEQMDRLRWRRGHPDEPPWIVFSTLAIQPTQPVIPMITPDSVQVERWLAYETALATQFSYLPPAQVICEWEVLGRRENEIYVWAVCGEIKDNRVGLEGLAVIYAGGPVPTALRSDDPAMYPKSVLDRYFSGLIHFQELVDHLRERQKHSLAEPPLIILNAKRTP